MAFDLDGLPDLFVHTQFALHSNAPLPAYARRILIVDMGALTFSERPDVSARFALVMAATLEPIAGLSATWLSHRTRPNPFTPTSDGALRARYDEQRFLYFQLENTTGSPLSLADGAAKVTVVGVPLAARPDASVAVAAPPLPAQPGVSAEIEARTLGGVTLSQNWFVLMTPGELPTFAIADENGDGAQAGLVPVAPHYDTNELPAFLSNIAEGSAARNVWVGMNFGAVFSLELEQDNDGNIHLNVIPNVGSTPNTLADGDQTPTRISQGGDHSISPFIDVYENTTAGNSTLTFASTLTNKWGFLVVKNLGSGTVSFAAPSGKALESAFTLAAGASGRYYLSGTVWRTF